MKTYNAESGRSMIEMLGVLAIIGVLSVGGIAGYSKAMHKYRVNKAIEQITLIAGNVRAFWGPQKNYIGVGCYGYDDGTCDASGCYGHSGVDAHGKPTNTANGCPIVKKGKIFPDEMITVTEGKIMSIANPFGGGVSLFAENKSKSGDYQAFRISYGVRKETEACIELLTYDWSNANASKVCAHHMSTADNCFSTQVPIEDAVTECSNLYVEDGPSVDIYFNM